MSSKTQECLAVGTEDNIYSVFLRGFLLSSFFVCLGLGCLLLGLGFFVADKIIPGKKVIMRK